MHGGGFFLDNDELLQTRKTLTSAEITALSHLYRGEVYRSTHWRTRLDTTTNWAVVSLGIALSITFAAPESSPVPLVLVGILIVSFLMLEARRYRYFNLWRARCRWMENHFFAPMLHDGDLHLEENWQQTLAEDYWVPKFHVSMAVAVGHRIRRNYLWILMIQAVAYAGKLAVHPSAAQNIDQVFQRAEVGPVPGQLMIGLGLLYVTGWSGVAIWSYFHDIRPRKPGPADPSMD